MKTLPDDLRDHLNSGTTTVCWCWKLTPRTGQVLGFTDHDCDLAFDDVVFTAASGFSGSDIRTSLGLSIDNLDAAGALDSQRLSEQALFAGEFDNASVEVWLVNWRHLDQRLLLCKGNLGEVTRGEQAFSAEIRGAAHWLNQPRGRLFQYSCDADLGDARCRVNVGDVRWHAAGEVTHSQADRRLIVTGLEGFKTGWFASGPMIWTTGANVGRGGDIKDFRQTAAGTVIELWQAAAAAVAAGDTFSLTAGCDKQFSTCGEKFSNAANFRGFPHMPGNDFVTSVAVRGGDSNDGASMNNPS